MLPFNHSTYLLLPLFGFNYLSLTDKLVNTYISKDTRFLYILLKQQEHLLESRVGYKSVSILDDMFLYQMEIPEKWLQDLEHFRQGAYSKLSKSIINVTKLCSGLPVNAKMKTKNGNKTITHEFIIFLSDRDTAIQILKEKWLEADLFTSFDDIPVITAKDEILILQDTEFITTILNKTENGKVKHAQEIFDFRDRFRRYGSSQRVPQSRLRRKLRRNRFKKNNRRRA